MIREQCIDRLKDLKSRCLSMTLDSTDIWSGDVEALSMAISALRREHEEAKKGVFKTIWETPEVCPACFEHLSRDWSFCPECGYRTDWTKEN